MRMIFKISQQQKQDIVECFILAQFHRAALKENVALDRSLKSVV